MTIAARAHVRRARGSTALLGPALVVAVAYVDPGNVATNTAAGARYGYVLVWVVIGANAMAGLVQYLSAKLGIVTGQSLPEALRTRLPHWARVAFWGQAEIVTMATDIAEILGGAIALRLLFGLPLVAGGVITAAVSILVLKTRDRRGQRRFETVLITMLGVVAAGFVAGLFVAPPDPTGAAAGLVPTFSGSGSIVLAAGMLGATVMPHAIYAHSALARDRYNNQAVDSRRAALLSVARADVTVALLVAGGVNLALLLLGATALAGDNRSESIDGVHAAIGDHLGSPTAIFFAVALLFSGIASTAVGCYSGSVVIGGLLRIRVPLMTRRLVTAAPALALLALRVDPTLALVLSQVALSFGIPFALVPLVLLTSRRSVMLEHVNRPATAIVACAVCAAIVALNLALIAVTFGG